MKCGSCRRTDADSYSKAKEQKLFAILKNLNPRRAYNAKYPFFCEKCLQLANAKLSRQLNEISEQNPTSFSTRSDSSTDEYDLIVAPPMGKTNCASIQ